MKGGDNEEDKDRARLASVNTYHIKSSLMEEFALWHQTASSWRLLVAKSVENILLRSLKIFTTEFRILNHR